MSQTVKANKTLNNLKKASSALATVLKLLARFFTQLGFRFDGWTIVSQRRQMRPRTLGAKRGRGARSPGSPYPGVRTPISGGRCASNHLRESKNAQPS